MRRLSYLVLLLFVVLASPVLGQESRPDPPDWVTNATIATGATLALAEIVASEACIQRGSCYEANRLLPDGTSKGHTLGRALIKGSGTALAATALLKLKRRHPRWAFVGSLGLVAWNGYLTKRALERFPPEARR